MIRTATNMIKGHFEPRKLNVPTDEQLHKDALRALEYLNANRTAPLPKAKR